MMADRPRLDADARQLLQNLLGHGRAHPTGACWPLFPLAQGPCSSGWHDVGRRLAVKGGETRHRDESLIRHSRGGKHNTLISFSLDAAGPAVEEGPRMISLSSYLDAAASVRPSVMEVTRQQQFPKQFDKQAQLPRTGCWHQCLNSGLTWGSRADVYCE